MTKKTFQVLGGLDQVIDQVSMTSARYYSTLDLRSGYHQLDVKEEDRDVTSFITPHGLFRFRKSAFGLQNAPSFFVKTMKMVLRGLSSSTACYIDDVLVFSSTFKGHIASLDLVFQRLRHFGLKLHPSKCFFARDEVAFLGHTLTAGGLKCAPDKVEAMTSFPRPQSKTQVKQYLGLLNFYRRYIKNFSILASPLHNLLRKDVLFQWTQKEQESFDNLKKALLTSPPLAFPDSKRVYILTCDAAAEAISYILTQENEGRELLISAQGRSLNAQERAWPPCDRECLAIVCGIKQYRQYLSHAEFIVRTDNKALLALQAPRGKLQSPRLLRWALFLQAYSYRLEHHSGTGTIMAGADALSRRPYGPPPPDDLDDDIAGPDCTLAAITLQPAKKDNFQFWGARIEITINPQIVLNVCCLVWYTRRAQK